jgi:hypothetical protein
MLIGIKETDGHMNRVPINFILMMGMVPRGAMRPVIVPYIEIS